MKRIFDKDGEATNARLTDEMLERANAIVDENKYKGNDVVERTCYIWGKYFPNRFSIMRETETDYQSYKFLITDDGDIKYAGMEGNWKD